MKDFVHHCLVNKAKVEFLPGLPPPIYIETPLKRLPRMAHYIGQLSQALSSLLDEVVWPSDKGFRTVSSCLVGLVSHDG